MDGFELSFRTHVHGYSSLRGLNSIKILSVYHFHAIKRISCISLRLFVFLEIPKNVPHCRGSQTHNVKTNMD